MEKKADFNFDLLDLDNQKIDASVKGLVSSQLAHIKDDNIDPITAFEWALQVKQKGFLTFTSSSEYDKIVNFIKVKSELTPFVKGFILTELKKQNE